MNELGNEIDWQHLERNTVKSLRKVCEKYKIVPKGSPRKIDYVYALMSFRDSDPAQESPKAARYNRRTGSPIPIRYHESKFGGSLTPQPQKRAPVTPADIIEPKVTSITPILKRSGDPPNVSRSPKFKWNQVRQGRPVRKDKPKWPLYVLLSLTATCLMAIVILQTI